ncbi:MAG: AMP-binding protein [Ignavibacteria bacterium]|nr:AMP-binding protein [Ignavibacteria bacterium]
MLNSIKFVQPGDSIAISAKEGTFTYTELLQHINRFSERIRNKQLTKVAIFSENRPEWIFSFYAAWDNSAIVVPLDYMAKPDEIAFILNDCQPELIFCSKGQLPVWDQIRPLLNSPIELVVIDDLLGYSAGDFEAIPIEKENVNEVAVIIYTSGTTGSPKGVMLTYDNLMANIIPVSQYIPIYTSYRTLLILLPLHHIFPLLGSMVAPVCLGAKVAICPSMQSEDIISTLHDNQVRIIIGVPRFYEAIRKGIMDKINKHFATRLIFRIARLINSQSVSRKIFKQVHEKFGGKLDYLVCGGAKLPEALAKDYKTLGFEILEGFGMTEAAPMITFTRPGRWKIGSAGELLHGVEVKFVDGELAARGRNVMKGYYNRPEETAEILRDGWLFTGDLGYQDKEGFIHITGRRKEIIVLSNGKNINPEEIEIKLKKLSPFIAEVAVFCENDQLQAIIYPDYKRILAEGNINVDEMFRWKVVDAYNHSASSYKKLSKFFISKEELPKTRLGKIQRFKLADMVENANKKKKTGIEPDFQEYIVIRDYLKEAKNSDVAPDDHLEIDLGLDSLDKVNLQAFLESTFGTKIQEEVFHHHPTVEKLSLYMREKKNKLHVEAVKWAEILREKVDFKLPESWFTHNLFKNLSKIFFSLYFRIKGDGTENIPEGPFILAPNHQSFFDGIFVSVFLKKEILKNTYFYAKEKHLRNRLVKALANRNNVIIMDLNKDLKESLQKLAAVLQQNKNIIIFPEGTRTYTGALGEFKKFFAILSLEFNVPIVPVSIKGAIDALPRGSFFPRPWKKIVVKFHKPILPEGHSYDSLTEKVYNELAQEIN